VSSGHGPFSWRVVSVGSGVFGRVWSPRLGRGVVVGGRWPAPVTGWWGHAVGVSHPFAATVAAWSGSGAAGWTQSEARPAGGGGHDLHELAVPAASDLVHAARVRQRTSPSRSA
jgi:hypothetical protein